MRERIDRRPSRHHAIGMAPKKTETVKKLFHVSREAAERLRLESFRSRQSQSEIVRQALTLWFARETKKH